VHGLLDLAPLGVRDHGVAPGGHGLAGHVLAEFAIDPVGGGRREERLELGGEGAHHGRVRLVQAHGAHRVGDRRVVRVAEQLPEQLGEVRLVVAGAGGIGHGDS
jgi:hypothetical protein